jgi:hypothetical protein
MLARDEMLISTKLLQFKRKSCALCKDNGIIFIGEL